MRIQVRRSGGYAGAEEVASVDTSRLQPGQAQQVKQLLSEATAAPASEPIGADLMRYEITVEDEGQTRTLSFTDDGSPNAGPVKRLIETLGGL